MFPGEFELLNHIERLYQCSVSDLVQMNIPAYIPEEYRVVDNMKLLEGFLDNRYVSCNRKSLKEPGAELEIQPAGRDALQRYREYTASLVREQRAEKRERLMLAVTIVACFAAVAAAVAAFLVK